MTKRNGALEADRRNPNASINLIQLSEAELDARIAPQVGVFCTGCHALPSPDEAPREEWRHEVEFAYSFHRKSPRKNEPAPDMGAVVAYFERKATPYDQFGVPPRAKTAPESLKFAKVGVPIGDAGRLPAIAGLTWLPPSQNHSGALLCSDMRFGGVYSVLPNGESQALVPAGSKAISNACHAEPCDLNGDGLTDFVVSDLGHFYPTDELFGRVVWLKRNSAEGDYKPVELAAGLGRVADVQPADFDLDGDQDLLVAEFGLYEAGRIVLLENLGAKNGSVNLALREIDPRHGTVCVPVTDLNGDGKLDFIALISQEHEVIEAFIQQKDAAFAPQRIYAAPNPSWGSSGLQLIDMDADGDLDLLYSNGDSFDRGYLKPYHAVRWLENEGRFPWIDHHLADMPGCQRALAGDLDADGDLDVVAVSLLPPTVTEHFGAERFDSICWLEQTAPGEFRRYSLEAGQCNHLSLAMADFDGDGDLDFAVGDFHSDSRPRPDRAAPVTIWRNESRAADSANKN